MIAKESTHWYLSRDCEHGKRGDPFYRIVGKNGKERDVTLRDLKAGIPIVPSVTTITRLLDRPGLANWMQDQAIMAALTLPRLTSESDADYIARIKIDGKEKARKAAERGTALHTDIERAIQGKPHGHNEHIEKIAREMNALGLDLYAGNAERSFAHTDGFGGRIDYSTDKVIVDFKSKDILQEDKKLAWPEHAQQLSAYGYGMGIREPRCINIFVGLDDNNVVAIEHEIDDIERGLEVFKLLLGIWQLKARAK